MLFHKKLYVDEEISKHKRKTIKNLKHGKLMLGVYVITLSINPQDELDIVPSYVLMQKVYKDMELLVVGIASDRDNALKLLNTMTMDCLNETGNVSLRQYFNM